MPGRTYQRRAALWSLILSCGLPSAMLAQDDAAVLRRIQAIRDGLPSITVDGVGADWGMVPAIPDTRGDADDPGRDLISIALLPTDDVLMVRLATAAAPTRSDRAFWINVDLAGGRHPEVQIGLSSRGNHFVRTFDEGGQPRALSRHTFPAAIGDVVEVAVPLEDLERLLRDRGPLRGPGARSWVRVVAFTWTRSGNRLWDFATAASYRIVPDPGALDPTLPDGPAAEPAVLDLPVEGRWLVSQGAHGYSTHQGKWAWDLTRTDESLAPSSPRESCDNGDFFAWGRPVVSPAPGTVRHVLDGEPDVSPCEEPQDAPSNGVVVELEGGLGLRLEHFRQGSVTVRVGERVARGAPLGRVGNSGTSASPHLHLEAADLDDPDRTRPLALRDVVVSLNPRDDDPWRRRVTRWIPRPGFFVEAPRQR